METLDEKIKRFLSTGYGYGDGSGYGYGDGDGYGDGYGSGYGSGSGYGYGYGDGDGDGDGYGYGYGDGYGYGYGYGSGYGYGYGYGYGDGSGSGDGDGIKSFNGKTVFTIDGVATVLTHVSGSISQGYIINSDLTTTPCFVAKAGNCFAHGSTSHEAVRDAQAKYEESKPLDVRIADFKAKYPTLDTVALNSDLFVAHHILTGSCLMGRKQFAQEHDIDVEHGYMTVREFLELTKDAYGGNAIRELKNAYANG